MAEGNGSVGPRDVSGRFLTGNSGGGRQIGARNKLGEQFITDMLTAWQAQGIDAINRVIAEKPDAFLKVVASLLPQKSTAEVIHRFVALMPAPARTVEEWEANRQSGRTINGTTNGTAQ